MDDEVMGNTVRMIKARSLVNPGGGVKIGPSLYFDATFSASARSSGVKSIRSSCTKPL